MIPTPRSRPKVGGPPKVLGCHCNVRARKIMVLELEVKDSPTFLRDWCPKILLRPCSRENPVFFCKYIRTPWNGSGIFNLMLDGCKKKEFMTWVAHPACTSHGLRTRILYDVIRCPICMGALNQPTVEYENGILSVNKVYKKPKFKVDRPLRSSPNNNVYWDHWSSHWFFNRGYCEFFLYRVHACHSSHKYQQGKRQLETRFSLVQMSQCMRIFMLIIILHASISTV